MAEKINKDEMESRFMELKNYGMNVLGKFGNDLLALHEEKLVGGIYYIDAENGKNMTEKAMELFFKKKNDVIYKNVNDGVWDKVEIKQLFKKDDKKFTLGELKQNAEKTPDELRKEAEEKNAEAKEMLQKARDARKDATVEKESLKPSDDEILNQYYKIDTEFQTDNQLCQDEICEIKYKLKKSMILWLYKSGDKQKRYDLFINEEIEDSDDGAKLLEKFSNYLFRNKKESPSISPFGKDAHESIEALTKKILDKRFNVFGILNEIKNNVLKKMVGGKKKSSRRSRKGGRKKRRSRRKTRRGGKRRIYRHLAVKAFLKKTKRRRKKKKTNKKKKRKQRTKKRR